MKADPWALRWQSGWTPLSFRVGPKGYVHGWIFVGAPGVGARVFHPVHGHGTVTSHEGGHAAVSFDSGTSHSFEVRPGGGPGRLQPQHAPSQAETEAAHSAVQRQLDEIPGMLGQIHEGTSTARLAVTIGNIKDELSEGPRAADWGYIRSQMMFLESAARDAEKRGHQGDSSARVLAQRLSDLRSALETLAAMHEGGSS